MINWFAHMYPYTNFHELNLDWVIATVRHGEKEIADFVGVNTIKYANPILWDITSQYEANTVVVDGQTGNAYISVKPVPSGVHLSRTEYWTQIYNYADVVDGLRSQIASNEKESTTATQNYNKGVLVFVNGLLYRVISNMIAGDSFVVDSNVEKTTIEAEIKRVVDDLQPTISELFSDIGDLDNLTTTDKSSLVNAINEVLNTLNVTTGDLDNLTTTDKSSLVNAINEIYYYIGDLDNLTTSDKSSVVNAINEIVSTVSNLSNDIDNISTIHDMIYFVDDYGAIGDGSHDDTQAFIDAITACPVGGTVYARGEKTYKITSTLYIDKRINLYVMGYIRYYGVNVCIDVMSSLAYQYTGCIIYINKIKDANGYSSQPTSVNRDGTIGVRINNMVNSKLFIGDIQGFTHAGIYFNTDGSISSGNVQQICLHNYFEFLEVANCGWGVYMKSLDASTSCTQANEFHINWMLQCYTCLVVDESTTYATDSNLFFITAIDNAQDHGILINGRWNLFYIAFMSTNIYFNNDSECNYVRVGNNTSTDVTVYYGGKNNDVNLAVPSSLPEITSITSGNSYQNTYGCKCQYNIQAYSTDGTNVGICDVAISHDHGATWTALSKYLISKDSTSTNRETFTFIVPAGDYFKVSSSNATLYRMVVSNI